MKKSPYPPQKARSCPGWHKPACGARGSVPPIRGTRKVLKLRRLISDTIPEDEYGYHLGDLSCKAPHTP